MIAISCTIAFKPRYLHWFALAELMNQYIRAIRTVVMWKKLGSWLYWPVINCMLHLCYKKGIKGDCLSAVNHDWVDNPTTNADYRFQLEWTNSYSSGWCLIRNHIIAFLKLLGLRFQSLGYLHWLRRCSFLKPCWYFKRLNRNFSWWMRLDCTIQILCSNQEEYVSG